MRSLVKPSFEDLLLKFQCAVHVLCLCYCLTTQKKIIRLIFNKKNRTPSTPLFIKAKILPLDYIYFLLTLSFMFKVYHNKYPPIIQNKFVRRYNISTQQTRQINLFEIPNFKTSLGERSVFYQGPKEFNHILRTTNVDLNIIKHNNYNLHKQ